ncbi:hypothetical protein B0H14DRAFT_3870287 [Mycena olivaceomarginata]|nr:hypothetical protein B0H14DRAFT_3870287 [Mycena olivaceomarginata]
MPPSATFFDIPLSSTFCADHEKSLLSLDWVLASGIKSSGSVASGVLSLPCEGSTCVMNANLSIKDLLPFDLVLGRDWHLFCRDSLPSARFLLPSGILDFAPTHMSFFLFSGCFVNSVNPAPATVHPIQACPMDVDADLDAGFPQPADVANVDQLNLLLEGMTMCEGKAPFLLSLLPILGHGIAMFIDSVNYGSKSCAHRTESYVNRTESYPIGLGQS